MAIAPALLRRLAGSAVSWLWLVVALHAAHDFVVIDRPFTLLRVAPIVVAAAAIQVVILVRRSGPSTQVALLAGCLGPHRVRFVLSQPDLDRLADGVERGREFHDPVIAGSFVVSEGRRVGPTAGGADDYGAPRPSSRRSTSGNSAIVSE